MLVFFLDLLLLGLYNIPPLFLDAPDCAHEVDSDYEPEDGVDDSDSMEVGDDFVPGQDGESQDNALGAHGDDHVGDPTGQEGPFEKHCVQDPRVAEENDHTENSHGDVGRRAVNQLHFVDDVDESVHDAEGCYEKQHFG